jgi:hypothetical protein
LFCALQKEFTDDDLRQSRISLAPNDFEMIRRQSTSSRSENVGMERRQSTLSRQESLDRRQSTLSRNENIAMERRQSTLTRNDNVGMERRQSTLSRNENSAPGRRPSVVDVRTSKRHLEQPVSSDLKRKQEVDVSPRTSKRLKKEGESPAAALTPTFGRGNRRAKPNNETPNFSFDSPKVVSTSSSYLGLAY